MKSSYKTRRHQLRAEIRALVRQLSQAQALSTAAKKAIADAMRGACLIGGCAERDRTLKVCREVGAPNVVNRIIVKPIKDMWDEPLE